MVRSRRWKHDFEHREFGRETGESSRIADTPDHSEERGGHVVATASVQFHLALDEAPVSDAGQKEADETRVTTSCA